VENYHGSTSNRILGGLAAFILVSAFLPMFFLLQVVAKYAIFIGGTPCASEVLMVQGIYAFTLNPLFYYFPQTKMDLITALLYTLKGIRVTGFQAISAAKRKLQLDSANVSSITNGNSEQDSEEHVSVVDVQVADKKRHPTPFQAVYQIHEKNKKFGSLFEFSPFGTRFHLVSLSC
jgi:hypothetical protein